MEALGVFRINSFQAQRRMVWVARGFRAIGGEHLPVLSLARSQALRLAVLISTYGEQSKRFIRFFVDCESGPLKRIGSWARVVSLACGSSVSSKCSK